MYDIDGAGEGLPAENMGATLITGCRKPGKLAFAQVLVALIQSWLMIDIGLQMSIITVVIGALYNHPEDSLNMNNNQASWFGSLQSLCYPLGSLTAGLFQDCFGRKRSMALINIPMFVAWLVLFFANSVQALYAVSIITGLCIGLSVPPFHSYIGEIGEPHLRGTLSTITSSAAGLGFLAMFLLAYAFGWRTVALICSACPVITFLCMLPIPESPLWLIGRGRLEEAKKSLCWLRGWVQPDEVEKEFQTLVSYTKNSTGERKLGSNNSLESNEESIALNKNGYLRTELRMLTNRRVLLPLRMLAIMSIVMAASGLSGLKPFIINELKDLKFPIDGKLFLIFSQIIFFAGNMLNVVFLRRFGKRKLALFSYGTAAVSIFGIGAHSSFLKGSLRFPVLVWTPLVLLSIVLFLAGFCTAVLPWQYICEFFPLKSRGTATGAAAAWTHFVSFVMTKSFLYLKAWVDFSGVMYLYAACTFLGVVYYYFYLPETEGKTLEQIGLYFTKNHNRKEKFSVGK